MEVRSVGRAHTPLPQAYGTEALQVPALPAILLQVGPPLTSHEKALTNPTGEPACRVSSWDACSVSTIFLTTLHRCSSFGLYTHSGCRELEFEIAFQTKVIFLGLVTDWSQSP